MNPKPEGQPALKFSPEELRKAEETLASSLAESKSADAVSFFSTVIDFETGLRRVILTQKQQRIFAIGEETKVLLQNTQNAEQAFYKTMKTAPINELGSLRDAHLSRIAELDQQRTMTGLEEQGLQADADILGADIQTARKMLDLFSKWNEKGLNLSLSTPTLNLLSRWGKESSIQLKREPNFLADTHDAIATSQSRTFGLSPTENTEEIIITPKPVHRGRPKLSNTPTVVHFNVSTILKQEGVDLSRLTETKPQGIAVSLQTLLRTDLGVEPTPELMDSMLRSIVRGEQSELLENRKTLRILDGLVKQKPTSVRIEEVTPQKVVDPEITLIEAQFTVEPKRTFATHEPKALKPILVIEDDDPLALIFTKIAKNDYLEITEPGLLAAAMTGKKARSEGRVSATARKTAMEKLQTNIIALTDTAKRQGILTLDKLADSNDIKIPDKMRTFFRNKCQNVPIANLAVIEGQVAAGYHQEKAKTLDQLALKLQKRKLSGN